MNRLHFPKHLIAPIVLVGVVWVTFAFVSDGFLSTGNLYGVLIGWSTLNLVAVGVGVAMIMGEFDLSVGSMAALGGVVAVRAADMGLIPALLVATIPLAVIGGVQGYLIYRLRINSLVFTIGTLILISGVAYLASDNTSIPLPISKLSYSTELASRIGTVLSPMAIVSLVFAIGVWVILTFARFGREIYALGGGRSETLAAGVRSRAHFVLAFACSAGAAALAGAMASFLSGGASPSNFSNLLLTAITAALVGGIAITGGAGSVIGICLGAFAIQSLSSGVALAGYQSFIADFLTGALLAAFLGIEAITRGVARISTRDASSFYVRRLPRTS